VAFGHGAGERAVMQRMFGETLTAYRQEENGWAREVIGGVFLRREVQMRVLDGGMREFRPVLKATIPGEESKVRIGDVIAVGEGPQISNAAEMAELRETGECYAVVRIQDNTMQPRLKHWRIEAE